jgi:PAS domain S-box-containing protein
VAAFPADWSAAVSEDLRAQLAQAEELIERLQQRERHFVAAQRISHVGSYDFDIATNTNTWSDELYRIYGHEPGAFHATYEKFLELVHPDDRETVVSIHQQALATMSAYQMEERIVWPDGQVRTLASWGEVVPDASGRPARMIGICWDVTEQKASAASLQRSSERFETLVRSAPDMVLVVSGEGRIIRANERLRDFVGYSPAELAEQPVQVLLPDGVRVGETSAVHSDGRAVPVDITTSQVYLDDALVTVAFMRDITDRKEHERLAMRLHDNDVRRRHALEINDNVVQGLASVLYLLDLERHSAAHDAARTTLEAARDMMSNLLTQSSEPLVPGELVREHSHVSTIDGIDVPETTPDAGALRVLLADDAADIRLLLRLSLSVNTTFEIIGEATNGAEAIELTAFLQPDVVVLDLSMPVMDGLQAIPELLRVCPSVRIIVLSGFDEGRMRDTALQLGAHDYVEKGEAASVLLAAMSRLFPSRSLAMSVSPAPADPETSGLLFDGEMMVHELRTPLTVITGMLATLRDRMDVLPSATTAELIGAALRNAGHMAELLAALSDARRASHGQLSISPEPTDIGELVRSSVSDLCAGHGWRAPVISAPDGLVAEVDPVRIRQVLANLLSNAYKFSPPGSPVTVTLSTVAGQVEIAVTDEGPGIPDQRRDELFKKFSRLGADGAGMGLGLFISRALARAHGGDLQLHDGPGTAFTLALPLFVRAPESLRSGPRPD